MFTLVNICYLVLEWGRYESWGVDVWDLLMIVWRGTECARLCWVCGGLGLGQFNLGKFLWCVFEKKCQCSSACMWHPGLFFFWSCNNLTALMRSLAILVASSLGVSICTWMCCGYKLYYPETRILCVFGTWNLGTCNGPKQGLCTMTLMFWHPWTSEFRGIEDILSCCMRDHGCLLKSCFSSNTWYAKSRGWTHDILRILSESWAWLMR